MRQRHFKLLLSYARMCHALRNLHNFIPIKLYFLRHNIILKGNNSCVRDEGKNVLTCFLWGKIPLRCVWYIIFNFHFLYRLIQTNTFIDSKNITRHKRIRNTRNKSSKIQIVQIFLILILASALATALCKNFGECWQRCTLYSFDLGQLSLI